MSETSGQPAPISSRRIAHGEDWRVEEVVCQARPGDPVVEERHAWTAIAAVLSGVFSYRTHQGRAVMTPGTVLLGEAGRCFECGHDHAAGDRCLSIHLSPALTEDILRGLERPPRGPVFAAPSLPPIDRLLPLMAEARALAASPDPLRAEQLCLGLGVAALALGRDAVERSVSADEEARASRAVRIIEARLAEPLSIAALAGEVGLARRRFATAFRHAVGASPYAYILNRRLDAAAERLRAGGGSVLEVALDVGFGDLSEFTRRFRARFGHPPRRYGRLLRGGAASRHPQ